MPEFVQEYVERDRSFPVRRYRSVVSYIDVLRQGGDGDSGTGVMMGDGGRGPGCRVVDIGTIIRVELISILQLRQNPPHLCGKGHSTFCSIGSCV